MDAEKKKTGLLGRMKMFFSRVWNRRHVIGDLMKHKHRFVVLDTETYKEKVSFQLSGINLFVSLGIIALVLVFITALLLALTPMREFIPGYSNAKMVEQTYTNARVIDSLEVQLHAQEELLADIQYIMLGKDPAERHRNEHATLDSGMVQPTPYTRSEADSLLRKEIEERGGNRNYAIPLRGKAHRKVFDKDNNRIIIDGKEGDKVMAVQSGLVLYAEKAENGEYTVVLQHSGIDASVYKAAGTLLKQAGSTVMAGEPILQLKAAKQGNSPTLTFQLLKTGESVDATKWIDFN